MKFSEYVNQEEKRKINRKLGDVNKNQQNVFIKALKAIPSLAFTLVKKTFKIFVKLFKMGFMIIKWIINELLECIMLLNQIMTTFSERKQKVILGIILSLILLLTGYVIYARHQNGVLHDDIATMQQSIETGETKEVENKPVDNKPVKKDNKKDNNKAIKTIKSASAQQTYGDVYFNNKVNGKSDYYGKGYVRYKENGEINVCVCNTYGLGEFTDSPESGLRYVKNVTDYFKQVDPEFYQKYFGNVNGPGTTTFTTGWQTAARQDEDKMKKYQFQYLYITYVENTMKDLKSKYGIDTNNKAMKELVFASSVQYGYKGTMYIFEQAGIEKGMSTKEIITKVENEKIDSINNYTYTDGYKYDDQDREKIKNQINNEKEQILNLI